MDALNVVVSAVVGAVTSAITAYYTSRLKLSEEREKWARDLSQKYAEALKTNPAVAGSLAKQFAIALLIVNEPERSDKEGRQKIFLLPNSRLVVGRAPESDIVVADDLLSRQHATFSSDATHIFIESMAARGLVFVNDAPVLETRAVLRSGDVVSMGHTRFEVLLLS